MPFDRILNRARDGHRLSKEEALELYQAAPFLELGQAANDLNTQKNGTRASYLVDGNINYSNICSAVCRFCAFYRPKGHKGAWELSTEELDREVARLRDEGASQVLLQGGLHPDHPLDHYVEMVGHLSSQFPTINIHALSPPEIVNIAEISKISIREVLQALFDAGMKTMPGGGAEILVDRVRDRISVGKCNSDEWLSVMRNAHEIGMRTTSTMMFGHIETIEDRIEHLNKLRTLQDETGGFLSFIPWTFQPEHTALNPRIRQNKDVVLAGSHAYLKTLAIARLFLDNFDHIQASCLTQGMKIGQLGLLFGSDDLGSVMLEEKVVKSAGCEKEMTVPQMIAAIEELEKKPYERNTFYQEISGRN